ncbi:MAG TPA: restriction endonuclease subunit S [Cyclobacteriaceae bacterium]|nr:restriction endonuclease subunit S [Cyclobacteriaceae bacterium]
MTGKILNSFDIWIGAQGWKSKLRLRDVENVNHEGIDRLRELILELAILGKLLPQDPSDESADTLLRNISKEKDRLIEGGELRKQKVLLEIAAAEKHFELPKGWAWARLGNIGDTNIGLTYSPTDVSDHGTPVLRSSNVQNGQISLDDLVRVSSKVDSKNFVENGDLLICARNGSRKLVGKCAIIKHLKERMAFGAFMAIFRSPLNNYIKYFLESPFYRKGLEGVSTTTINQITQETLKNTVIPLPPLAEQQRIVSKVNELMALCDELEEQETNHLKSHQLLVTTLLGTLTQAKDAAEFQTAWATLAKHFDDLFITEDSVDQLKQTILQLALMGKLVPQDPKDEPASVLLERIKKEKERLIREGELNKQNAPSPIGDAEGQSPLPQGWELERFGNVVFNRDAERDPLSVDERSTRKGEYDYYGASGVIDKIDDYIFDKPLLLIGEDGANLINRTTPIAFMARGKYWVNNHAHVIDGLSEDLLLFVCLYINAISLEEYVTGTAQPKMNQAKMNSIIMKIPPLGEQKRIVLKVEELFGLCDGLKHRITERQKIANLIADSILEQVR